MAKSEIDNLTPAQLEKLEEYKAKWIKIGLCTDPCDIEESKKWAVEAYKTENHEPPKYFYLAKYPIYGAIMDAHLKNCWATTPPAKGKSYDAKLEKECWEELLKQSEGQVPENLLSQMRAYKPVPVTQEQVWQCLQNQLFGPHDAGWLGFNDFFLEVVGLKECQSMKPLIELAKVCGWWTPCQDYAIFQHRAEKCLLDDQERLHCEDGPAIAFPGGWGIYVWHGVRVPEVAIMRPHEITIQMIKSEQNAEVRRILTERYGLEKYLQESNAKIVHSDIVKIQEGAQEAMPRVLFEDANGDRYLYGTDGSTERCYVMQVPREARTCREAHEMIGGIDESMCVAQS